MKHLFVVNPIAGKGKTLNYIPAINAYFEKSNEEYEIEITKYPGHATIIASEYSSKGDYRIYSIGGDGTLNEVLNGMAGSNSSLAVVPSGSGNDFIKSVSDCSYLGECLSKTINGDTHLIDIAKVNNRYYINIASLGFDGQVAHSAGFFKKLPLVSGQLAYILGILSTILMCKKNTLEIDIDGLSMKYDTLLIAIGNGKYYGGGMLALPEARIDDGLLEICLAERMSRIKIFHLFPKYIKGLHASIKGVHFFKGKRIEIKSNAPIAMNTDGEISLINEAVFEILPKSLNFIFPKQ